MSEVPPVIRVDSRRASSRGRSSLTLWGRQKRRPQTTLACQTKSGHNFKAILSFRRGSKCIFQFAVGDHFGRPNSLCLSLSLSVSLSPCLSGCLHVCLSVWLSGWLSICLYVSQSVCLSCLCVSMSASRREHHHCARERRGERKGGRERERGSESGGERERSVSIWR